MDGPLLIVIGGANGSGKTTLAREYVSADNLPYLGADQIAFELNPNDVESVAIQAGRLFIEKISENIARGESFIVESTLSGLSLAKWVRRAKSSGYLVRVLFVYLDSAQDCVDRVSLRVKKGGHFVPDEDIERRYERSNYNFWSTYRPLATNWALFNNSGDGIVQVAASGDSSDEIVILDEEKFYRWKRLVRN